MNFEFNVLGGKLKVNYCTIKEWTIDCPIYSWFYSYRNLKWYGLEYAGFQLCVLGLRLGWLKIEF